MSHPINPLTGKQVRGFAVMSLERRTAISRTGGANIPADKRAFSRDRTLAAEAGRKGGAAGLGKSRAKVEA